MAQAIDLALAVIHERGNEVEDRPLYQRGMLESPPHAHISPQAGALREGTLSRRRYFPDWKTSFAQRKATTAAGTPQYIAVWSSTSLISSLERPLLRAPR